MAKICRMTFDEILALQDRYKIIFKKVVNIISGLLLYSFMSLLGQANMIKYRVLQNDP